MDSNPLNLQPSIAEEIRFCGFKFLQCGIAGGMRELPKAHQLLHTLFDSMELHGNPRFYSNFLDESLNKDVKGIAFRAFSSVWHARIFICWKLLRDSRPRGLTVRDY